MTFENGQIVDITAEKGDQVMKDLVLRMLVRVPWVNVPWYQIQVQFLSQVLPSLILFRRNASNHLAIGAAYAN